MSIPQTPAIRVLLVDDHEMVRAGLRMLLGHYPQIAVVGEAGTVAEAVSAALGLRPDVLLLDVRLPDGTGFEVFRQVRQHKLDCRVLFLTAYDDDETLQQAVQLEADGFLLKDVSAHELAAAIEKVHAGHSILDATVTRRVLEHLKHGAGHDVSQRVASLSHQEKRVLEQVAQGKTNKEIAQVLALSDKTVKNYLANAMEKLQVKRRSQAAAIIVQFQASRA